MKNSSKVKTLILDANIWVYGILGTLKEATDIILKCIKGEYKILVNSYIAAEVTRVLKRIAIRIHRNPPDSRTIKGKPYVKLPVFFPSSSQSSKDLPSPTPTNLQNIQ